jgi:hypothetical protein
MRSIYQGYMPFKNKWMVVTIMDVFHSSMSIYICNTYMGSIHNMFIHILNICYNYPCIFFHCNIECLHVDPYALYESALLKRQTLGLIVAVFLMGQSLYHSDWSTWFGISSLQLFQFKLFRVWVRLGKLELSETKSSWIWATPVAGQIQGAGDALRSLALLDFTTSPPKTKCEWCLSGTRLLSQR